MGSRLAQAFSQKHRFAAWATASVGLLFIGFSLKLLLD
jgi:threonine/homoserine/homoserine lactone efflux protein